MVDINATIPLLEPVSYTFREVLGYIEFFVGGIFGIYLITLIVRLVFFRKIYKSCFPVCHLKNWIETK